MEQLEDRTLLSVTLLNNYVGLGSASQSSLSGFLDEPPDTNGAAGPNSYIETVNQAVSIYTPKTTGSGTVQDSLADFYFTQGGLPPPSRHARRHRRANGLLRDLRSLGPALYRRRHQR